ncbi:hypothetical protein, partial [Vibrio vulnificus]|uniref:hypothetical protein n=1 Tax=Vibrio vulnificus TaxID=672 RepID=UPI001EECA013
GGDIGGEGRTALNASDGGVASDTEGDLNASTPSREGGDLIIAVTANVFEEDEKKYRQAGFDDILAKPFNVDALQSVIETHCLTNKVKSRTV